MSLNYFPWQFVSTILCGENNSVIFTISALSNRILFYGDIQCDYHHSRKGVGDGAEDKEYVKWGVGEGVQHHQT